MKTVLFPSDYSPHAEVALPYAVSLAQLLGATLHILHVDSHVELNVIRPVKHWERAAGSDLEKAKWARNKEKLRVRLKEEYPDLQVVFAEEYGSPVAGIIHYAKKHTPAWTVMGTRGRAAERSGGPFGSVSMGVLKHQQLPVLLIPLHAPEPRIKHIGYASDFREEDLSTILTLVPMVKAIDGKLTCIHVRGHEDFWDKVQRKFFDQLYDLAQSTNLVDFKILRDGDVQKSLSQVVREEQIDTLAMLHRHHHDLIEYYQDSMTRRIALEFDIPLMVFHGE